jgi:hypothetical protein
MKKTLITLALTCLFFSTDTYSQDVEITIFANDSLAEISPYLYGRNNSFSDVFGTPTTPSDIQLYKEAGLRFSRENAGNNSTKYNWRKKLSSHPDWYNNVYAHDWDYASQVIQRDMPSLSAMWAFQLIGKVADNNQNNFNDWQYNSSQWWSGVHQNLAGGGTVNPDGGSEALVEGDTALYLTDWPADSTTAILDHWFGEGGLDLDKDQFQFWSMDNEPEIWSGTHDDVMGELISADEFLERYFKVAKLARQKFPEIKLTGPVPANEWQWYKWGDESLRINPLYYPWIEYFIKRVADEEKASGMKLLDMVDIHFYPGESSDAEIVQLHRVFYDKNYAYPGANGIRTSTGGWNTSLNKEYIFQRIEDWLDEYFGEGHGITVGLTEFEANTNKPNVNSVLYASMLGTFSDHGVEVFAPWTWKPGMWEVLHLFSRNAKEFSIRTSSTQNNTVSGYSSINAASDSVTVMLVNRDLNSSKEVAINLSGFTVPDGEYEVLKLSSLPASETFQSRSNNALEEGSVTISNDTARITLPPLSVSALKLSGQKVQTSVDEELIPQSINLFQNYPNPFNPSTMIGFRLPENSNVTLKVFDMLGREVETLANGRMASGYHEFSFNASELSSGIYFYQLSTSTGINMIRKMTLLK